MYVSLKVAYSQHVNEKGGGNTLTQCLRSMLKLGTFAHGSQPPPEIGQLLRPLPPTLKKVSFGLFHRM